MRREQPLDQLARRHLQRENRHGPVLLRRDVLGNVQRQRGLAHARPRRDHYQFLAVQSRGQLVQLREPGVKPRARPALLAQLRQFLDRRQQHVRQAHKIRARMPLRHGKHLLLGGLQDFLRRALHIAKALGVNLAHGRDQLPHQPFVHHDLRVLLQIRRGRHGIRQLRHVRRPARVFQIALRLQQITDCHQIHRLPVLEQILDRAEDQPVPRHVKRRFLHLVDPNRHRLLVHEHRAQNAALRRNIVRRHTLCRGRRSHIRWFSAHSVNKAIGFITGRRKL